MVVSFLILFNNFVNALVDGFLERPFADLGDALEHGIHKAVEGQGPHNPALGLGNENRCGHLAQMGLVQALVAEGLVVPENFTIGLEPESLEIIP